MYLPTAYLWGIVLTAMSCGSVAFGISQRDTYGPYHPEIEYQYLNCELAVGQLVNILDYQYLSYHRWSRPPSMYGLMLGMHRAVRHSMHQALYTRAIYGPIWETRLALRHSMHQAL